MRKLLVPITLLTALAAVALGVGPSSAGDLTATMQADPPSSFEPATVVVSNVSDLASRCEYPTEAAPEANGSHVQVSLMLTGDNGEMQADTVTPDGMGDWSQTYTGLPVGTYTVTGSCDVLHGAGDAAPQQTGPFTYQPVQFVVIAPAETAPADAAPAAAAGGVVRAAPAFTG